jgi:hypothetical protein
LDKELEKEKKVQSNKTQDEDDLMEEEFFKEYVRQKFEEMHKKTLKL